MQQPKLKFADLTSFLKKQSGILLLFFSLIIGLWVYADYGITWDDPIQRTIGEMNYNYVFKGDTALMSFNERDYGVAFELPLIIIEKALHLKDSRSIYLMRHLISHLFFVFSAFMCFLLIVKLYKSKLLASVGILLLLLNPLLYSHSFFNTKDIPFMAMFMVCFLLAASFFSLRKALIL